MNRIISALILMIVLATSGCDQQQDTAEAQPDSPPVTAADAPGPCSLLTAEEVSAVIGPLAGAPYRAGGMPPDVDGDICRYETETLRSLTVSVVWVDGARKISMMNMIQGAINDGKAGELKLINGTTLTGEWDEARLMGCCEFNALRGDQLVTVDFAGTDANLTQTASLVDVALPRLEKPLSIDDASAVAAAKGRESARPRVRSVCELVTRADAEALTNKTLAAEPIGDQDHCFYQIPLDIPGATLDLDLIVQWRNGFREMTVMQTAFDQGADMIMAAAFGQSNETVEADTDSPASEQEPGPWDVYSQSIVGVSAVKSDVLVHVDNGPFMQEVSNAFIAKAIDNLPR
ncbi:MAG: hypothetical protein KDI34_22040 [Halioglobus sp.]|nr:hypothetical protein [Halioglobus sp.]